MSRVEADEPTCWAWIGSTYSSDFASLSPLVFGFSHSSSRPTVYKSDKRCPVSTQQMPVSHKIRPVQHKGCPFPHKRCPGWRTKCNSSVTSYNLNQVLRRPCPLSISLDACWLLKSSSRTVSFQLDQHNLFCSQCFALYWERNYFLYCKEVGKKTAKVCCLIQYAPVSQTCDSQWICGPKHLWLSVN